MSEHNYGPAQIASVAARASANGTSAVAFQVWMTTGAESARLPAPAGEAQTALPFLEESLDESNADRLADSEQIGKENAGVREELLYFSSQNVGVYITTRGTPSRSLSDSAMTVLELQDADPSTCVFEGTAALNPGFLYETAHQLEVMIEFGRGAWNATGEWARICLRLARRMAALAVTEANAPIIFLHAPAAPFPNSSQGVRLSGLGERVRVPQGPCIRMSIALVDEATEPRLRFVESLGRLANEWGLTLHIGDRRPGRVRGEWVTIRAFSERTFRERAGEEGLGVSAPATRVLPVVMAGPARVGTTLAVLRALDDRKCRILGVSVSSLQEVAFITLLIDASGFTDLPETVHCWSVRDGLNILSGRRNASGYPTAKADFDDLAACADYVSMIGRPYVLPAVDDREGSVPERPLWVTWDVPFPCLEPDKLLEALGGALRREEVSSTVQYARARSTGDGRLRGRAKIALRISDRQRGRDDVREYLRKLSEAVEARVREHVVRDAHVLESEVRIRVMWRERWLGASSLPL